MEEISSPSVFKDHLDKCLAHFKLVLNKMRSGTADSGIIRNLKIKYYGSKLELYQIANISVPEPRLIQIKPYNKKDVKLILKSIQESNLNLNPTDTEELIRINLAPLTTEQKAILIKEAKKESENTRIAIRNVRRKAMDEINSDDELSDTSKKKQKDDLQKIVNEYNREIDTLLKQKITHIEKV